MIIQILIIVVCLMILILFFKKNKKVTIEEKGNDEYNEDDDQEDDSELISDWYTTEDDLKDYDAHDKAILIGMGTLVEKYDTYSQSLIASEEEVKKYTDYEYILVPHQKINILFDTSFGVFEDLGFKHSLVLSELTTTNTGFTECDLVNELCKFYRTHDKENDL